MQPGNAVQLTTPRREKDGINMQRDRRGCMRIESRRSTHHISITCHASGNFAWLLCSKSHVLQKENSRMTVLDWSLETHFRGWGFILRLTDCVTGTLAHT